MSKSNKNEQKSEVVALVAKCKSDGCKSKPTKFGFCQDHYEMYMAGVIKGDGSKPVDFEQKYALFMAEKNQLKKAA